MKNFLKVVIVCGNFLLVILCFPSQASQAQDDQFQWSQYVNLSNVANGEQVTEPKIVGDQFGYVHVVWSQSVDGDWVIYYARKYNQIWDYPIDIVASPNALVAAVDVDNEGYLHLLWYSGRNLFYSKAHISEALSSLAWSYPMLIDDRGAFGSSFSVDLDASVPNVLSVVYGSGSSPDVFFTISEDHGEHWSQPISVLGESISVPEVASEVRLARKGQNIDVVWVSRQMPRGWPGVSLMYAQSRDGGLNWTSQLVDDFKSDLYFEDRGPFFPTIFALENGIVHLTWAGAPQGERWFIWSNDHGETWQPAQPMTVFNKTNTSSGIPGTTGFTDMIVDSNGTLYATTTIGDSGAPRIAQWTNGNWGMLITSPYLGADCEDPRLAQTEGNQLHLVCVEQSGQEQANIWYAMFTTQAPPIDAQLLPLLSPQEYLSTPVVTTTLSAVDSETLISSATLDESARTTPSQQVNTLRILSLSIISTLIFIAVVLWLRQTTWRRS